MTFQSNDEAKKQAGSSPRSDCPSGGNRSQPPPPFQPDAVVTDLRLAWDANANAESPTTSQITTSRDPYNIGHGLKSDAQIAELRRRKRGKPLANFHRRQNDVSVSFSYVLSPSLTGTHAQLITSLLKPMEEHTEDARNEEVKLAVRASLIANIALAVLQMFAAISSASLSLLATGIDSVFDVGSNFVLYYIHHKSSRMDVNKWPVGGARLETIGNVIYGFLMGSVNFVVIIESMRDLINHGDKSLNQFHVPSVVAVGAALGVKFLLFLYCYSSRSRSSQVEVLWEDHRNDLFINSFGLLMSAGGSKLAWCTFFPFLNPSFGNTRNSDLDPIGAIIIALAVIVAWTRTVYRQFELLAGKSAPHDFLQLIIYKAMTFNDEIEKIDTSGPDYFVEVDVVMDANTPLWKAHDISQQLQDKIEVLPNVGRAFVHVDHETTHIPEHRKHI
ncbi:CDF manganese transporter [Russula brevipes]|nr:CDF manganese transporter [Russula brevipes]